MPDIEVTLSLHVDEWDGDLAATIAESTGPVLLEVGGYVFDVNVERAQPVDRPWEVSSA